MKKKSESLSRAARIFRLGAGVAGGYLAHQVQRPFLSEDEAKARRQSLGAQQAKRVREELQSLRGPIMKVGQALSMQTQALDPAWIEELSTLQRQAPPMHPSLIRAQFKSAMGKYPEEVFRSFEPEPFAAASLGQVHFAVTQAGEEVAVKIQYPAIREAIESDFKALRAAGFAARMTGHLKESVVQEAERGILEETDYVREADNLEYFRKHLEPLSFVRVPKVYRDLSSRRVLTMSRLGGRRLQEFLESNPSQEMRDRVGAQLVRLFFFQLFRMKALHADPHPGNYLFNDDGSLGLVDFGCVKHLKPEVVRCYGQFWSREWVQSNKIYAEMVRVAFPDEYRANARQVRRSMEEIKRFYDEFHPLADPPVLLDLGDPRFMEALGQLAKVLLKNKFLSPDFLFLSRTESGMCNILHILKTRVRTTQIVRELISPEVDRSSR
ncbi:MAG TPA: AarF/ABC1/UbiB kinase family protein [Candidatus Limnocylindria bacterium]|nr:AarF/ABC1/UbiB kinase family protein [Candidatus Limnocylindria bacterium]